MFYNETLKIYSEEYMKSNKNIFLRYSFLINNRDYWENKFSSKIDLSVFGLRLLHMEEKATLRKLITKSIAIRFLKKYVKISLIYQHIIKSKQKN